MIMESVNVDSPEFDFFKYFKNTNGAAQGQTVEIENLYDITNLGVKEIQQIRLDKVEFSSVNEVMKFKDILFSVFNQVTVLNELSI